MNLSFLFEQDFQCARLIMSFLKRSELARFCQVSEQIKQSVNAYKKELLNEEYKTWRQNKMSTLKKLSFRSKKNKQATVKFIETDENYIIKMRIFDIPLKYLDQENWDFMNESDEQYVKMIKSDKFIKEYNNLFFKNKNRNDILFINRSMIDNRLNYQENEFDEEQYEQNKYSELFSSEEFSSTSFDFSNMESLLSRQKEFIKRMNKKESQKLQTIENVNYLDCLPKIKKITIILCHGGYFSIGIFNETGQCIFHKTDHKYVVRKKAGKRQLTCGKGVSSIGSQIRKDQEKLHQEKVHNILTDKFDEIDKTDIVFLHAPGINKLILIKENEPLMKLLPKIRSICLTAKKAKFTEVERIYKVITKIYLVLKK